MEKTPKNDAGKKASELIIKCDKLVEPVTNCDQSNEVVANCDYLLMFSLTKEEWNTLRSQIATTKQLDNEKNSNLKSQFATSSWGGVRKRPYAFTRNGIAMLSSVLRSETAVDVNIRIMRAFTSIPQIVNNNALMMQRILNTLLWHCEQKSLQNIAISREKGTLFLNLCSQIILFSIFLIIFAHRTLNVGQE